MPWTPADAKAKTHKASSPKKQRQWSAVANNVLERTGDDGQAIRQANAVVARAKGPSKRK
jgi:hypothetical protein